VCAIHGGTFILNKGVEEVLFNDDGTVAGVRSGSGDDAEVALAPLVIGDPSYFEPARVKKVGRVIRTVCVIDHPVKGLEVPDSGQIILPQHQLKRSNDVYVSIVGPSHQVAAKGRYVAIESTTVETAKPQEEVNAGLALLAPLVAKFDNIVDSFVPVDDGTASRCFITASYDASSHFEATSDEVLDLYRRIMGESLDMNIKADVNTGGD